MEAPAVLLLNSGIESRYLKSDKKMAGLKNKMKKINYYYLVAGFLALLFSITHELNGQRALIPALYAGELDINTVTTFKYI